MKHQEKPKTRSHSTNNLLFKTNPFVNTNIFTDPNHRFFEMSDIKISSTNFNVAGYDIPIGLSWSNMI